MAQYLMKSCMLFASSFLFTPIGFAEVLIDPTKPPFDLLNPEVAIQEQENREMEPVLQSVTLGTHIKSAMINGQLVPLGQRYKQYRLVSVSANKAVLQRSNGVQKVLQLSFSINKQAVQAASSKETTQSTKRSKKVRFIK